MLERAREAQSDYARRWRPDPTPRCRPDAGAAPPKRNSTGKTAALRRRCRPETNGAPVWIDLRGFTAPDRVGTDTALSRSERLGPPGGDPQGRENYLCLLNWKKRLATWRGRGAAPRGHGRWAAATNDGGLTGATFPAWLTDLAGRAQTIGLADRRGECIHSACTHYNRCFVEKSVRRSRRADIVISNHALVMINAAYAPPADPERDQEGGERRRPMRYVFDEGHHLFDAADSAFSLYLTRRKPPSCEAGSAAPRMAGAAARAD